MRIAVWVLAVVLLGLSACVSGADEFAGDHNGQATLEPGVDETLDLLSGAAAHFPALTFGIDTIVILADVFASTDAVPDHYPTATHVGEDLLAGLVVNTPADCVMEANIDVTFRLINEGSATAGEEYAVFRFDFDNLRWNRWGGTFATIQAGATTAKATLPTDGMRGFIGSLAIFKGLTMAALPAVEPTTIEGTVVDASDNPLSTDVGIYFIVGTTRVAVPITNGTIPAGGTVANTVNSDAAGHFTMQIPESLIGQVIDLEFGREDANLAVQRLFDVLAPATPATAVDSMILRYGENNVVSQPVATGTDTE